MKKLEENPFEDPEIAILWITSVESEKNSIRERHIYPLLTDWLRKGAFDRVLDIGCGQGVAAPMTAPAAYIGIDPSATLIARAKENNGGAGTFLVGDAYALPVADASSDAAFSINVWFHLKDITSAFREASRALKPDGEFLLITANPEAHARWQTFYEDIVDEGHMFSGRVHIPHVTLPKSIFYRHTEEETQTALTAAGFTAQQTKEFPDDEGPAVFRSYYLKKNSR